MSESAEPGSQAIFTHSPCRGLAASRAAAVLKLGGSAGLPCEALAAALGAAMSPALMCAMCSSAFGRLWHAVIAIAARELPRIARILMIDSVWECTRARQPTRLIIAACDVRRTDRGSVSRRDPPPGRSSD